MSFNLAPWFYRNLLGDNEIIIPRVVLEELADLRRGGGDKGHVALEAARQIENYSTLGGLVKGVETEKGGLSRADKGTDRKEAAVAKNLDAANRQPASTKKAGADSDKHGQTAPTPEADQMTYEEFSALPDSTKAKMRGDFVA